MIGKEIARKYAERWEFWSRSWCKSSSDGECFAADCPQTKNKQHTCPRSWLRGLSDSDYVPDPLSDDERGEFFNFIYSQIERSNGLDEMSIYCNIVDLAIYLGLPSDTSCRRLIAESNLLLNSDKSE